jgi:predicted acylesterase/phospholipase RssA
MQTLAVASASSSGPLLVAFWLARGPMRTWMVLLTLAATLSGCGTILPYPAPPNARVAEKAIVPGHPLVRFWGDEVPTGNLVEEIRRRLPTLPRHMPSDTSVGGRPIVEYLALSGGGPDGAFGAGLLAGWTKHGTRPQFEVVTGISAGAIIAPFAFLGPRYDRQLEEIWTRYETSEIITARILPGLLGGPALADTAPLASLVARYVDRKLLRTIAAEYRRGRLLLIGTTNLYAQRPVIWNMGEIAASSHPDAVELFRQVIMASAAIPGAFPPVHLTVEADGQVFDEMHVDGGVTRQVFIVPVQLKLSEFDKLYGERKPVRRIYIISNGKVTPEFKPVQPTAISIAARSITTLTKIHGEGDIYRIWRMARDSNADFNLAAIPAGFEIKATQAFDPQYQKALYDVGYATGLAGGGWTKMPNDLKPSPLAH